MKLSDDQKRIVENIGDSFFTVEFLERFYKQSPMELYIPGKGNFSYVLMRIREADAFMAAVDGMLKSV